MARKPKQLVYGKSIEEFAVYFENNFPLKPETRRRYSSALNKLTKYVEENHINQLTNRMLNSHFDQQLNGNIPNGKPIAEKTIATDKLAIREYIYWGKANGCISRDETFDICENTTDRYLELYDRKKIVKIYSYMDAWAEGTGQNRLTAQEIYRRRLISHYVKYMTEARPVSDDIAKSLKWSVTLTKEYNDTDVITYNGKAVPVPVNAKKVISSWYNLSIHRKGTDYIFSLNDGNDIEVLDCICRMVMDIKVDVMDIVKRLNISHDELYKHKGVWDILVDMFEDASKILRSKHGII